jgi:hypothetical protein
MKINRIVGFAILVVSFVFWFSAIASASNAGFFADASALELMVMGGAIASIAALVLWDGY